MKKYSNETSFQRNFDVTFDSQTTVKFLLIISTESTNTRATLITQIYVHIKQTFSADTIFSFTYQWPTWPLTKTCAGHILEDLSQNQSINSQRRLSCSRTSILKHTTAQQLFDDERMPMKHWLDIFYKATNPPALTTQNRRLSSLEIASNAKICTVTFHN